jgi:hypothetical protein
MGKVKRVTRLRRLSGGDPCIENQVSFPRDSGYCFLGILVIAPRNIRIEHLNIWNHPERLFEKG